VIGESFFARMGKRLNLGDVFAGCITAAVFYAEYLSLGATLSAALPGQSGAALGTNMVMGSVLIGCVSSIFLSKPLLSGPRAASIAVLIFGMKYAADHVTNEEARLSAVLIALFVIVLTTSVTQLLGLSQKVQGMIANSPLALRKGFMYATATAIAVGASLNLNQCLRISPVATFFIVSISLGAAMAWTQICKKAGTGSALGKASSLSMVIGVAIASLLYYFLIFDLASSGQCGTLGSFGLALSSFDTLRISKSSMLSGFTSLPIWIWPILFAIGVLTGVVTLLENLSTLGEARYGIVKSEWSRYIGLNAAVNCVAAPLGLSCSSFSASRTAAIIDAQGRTNAATVWHGIALAVILVGLTSYVGKIPQLAITVAILLVAVQMIDDEMANKVWGGGFKADTTAKQVQTSWGFLATLGLSIVTGLALKAAGVSFSAGAVVSLVVGSILVFFASRRYDNARK
jgi:hypothetical protein